jgi:hypothetical protein
MKKISAGVNFLSGEWVLDDRANGGLVILLRTAWVSALMYAFALLAREISNPRSLPYFSLDELRRSISETIPWLGAITGAVYAAFYARFSSQWQYLAHLYNQLMETGLSLRDGEYDKKRWINWRAGFIEDAYCLHLAGKPMFATAINDMLRDRDVLEAYKAATIGAESHLLRMRQQFQGLGVQRLFDLASHDSQAASVAWVSEAHPRLETEKR